MYSMQSHKKCHGYLTACNSWVCVEFLFQILRKSIAACFVVPIDIETSMSMVVPDCEFLCQTKKVGGKWQHFLKNHFL